MLRKDSSYIMNGYKFSIPHFGLARQYRNLKEELLSASDQVLRSGQLIGGKYTKDFESWLRTETDTKFAITVHSGTQALEIIARWKKKVHQQIWKTTPKIRIPNLTYPATLTAFISAGWDVELVDTDRYGIINLDEVLNTGEYVCLVGLYGKKPWPEANYDLTFSIIVDGAQHWLVANGDVGSGMAISFDPTKNLPSSGNGGAIVTNIDELANFAYNYRDNSKFNEFAFGTNSKMSEQDCAQILVRTKYLTEWQSRRRAIAEYWCDRFSAIDQITCLSANAGMTHAHQKFVIYTADRNTVHTTLILHDIESKIHYDYVLGDLPICKDFTKPNLLSMSVMLSRGVVSLPLYPELTDGEVEYIAERVESCYK